MTEAKRVAEFHRASGLGFLEAREFMRSKPHALCERIMAAHKQQGDATLHDPVEDDVRYSATISAAREDAERIALEELGGRPLGSCHFIWGRMREILKEQHGIDWYSPAEMNPGSCFD